MSHIIRTPHQPQPPEQPHTHSHPPRSLRLLAERGSVTAEYAIATMAAVGFAGLLVVIMRGDEVKNILLSLVRSALSLG